MTSAFSESLSEVRLHHSTPGLVRLGQMGEAQCVIYVEGLEADRYYYSSVLSPVVRDMGVKAEFRLSREIGGAGEGKVRCLSHFNYLRENGKLVSDLESKKTLFMFFLDKDIDDLLGKLIYSPHVCYTEHYCVENHIICETDVVDSLAAAISWDPAALRTIMAKHQNWVRACCESWREWVVLCVFSKLLGSKVANYSRRPRFDADPAKKITFEHLSDEYRLLREKSELDYEEFERLAFEARSQVDEYYRRGKTDSLFKGKWYGFFLSTIAKEVTKKASCNESSIWATATAKVDKLAQGSNGFRIALQNALQLLVA